MPEQGQGGAAKRIQRKRSRGWRMPPNTVYVGRPTIWGNPFSFQDYWMNSLQQLVDEFRRYAIRELENNPNWLKPLQGKDLACWCNPNNPCHADVLLELANSQPAAQEPERGEEGRC